MRNVIGEKYKKYDISGSGNNGSRTTAKDAASKRLIQLTCFHSVTSESIGELQQQPGHPDISSRLQASIGTVVTPAVERPIKTRVRRRHKSHVARRVNRDLLWVALPGRTYDPETVRRIDLGSASTDDRRQPGGQPAGRPVAFRRRLDVVKISTSVISSWPVWRRRSGTMRCDAKTQRTSRNIYAIGASRRYVIVRLNTMSCCCRTTPCSQLTHLGVFRTLLLLRW